MLCAAKVWKIYVGSSHSCRSLQRRFGSSWKSSNCGPMCGPNNLNPPIRPIRSKQRGLYSIETFPKSHSSRDKRHESMSPSHVTSSNHQTPQRRVISDAEIRVKDSVVPKYIDCRVANNDFGVSGLDLPIAFTGTRKTTTEEDIERLKEKRGI